MTSDTKTDLEAPPKKARGPRPDFDKNPFRIFVKEELLLRTAKNPSYSLRAFAKSLQVEHSALSKILSGKRSLTPEMIYRISTRLGVSRDQTISYIQNCSEDKRSSIFASLPRNF